MYTAERFFVKTAHEQMCVLEAIWSPGGEATNAAPSQSGTLAALEKIKSAAQSVKARGVYRIASLCEDVYVRLGIEGAVKLRGSLVSLKCLVYQYADGLFEIDPEFKAILIGHTQEREKPAGQAVPEDVKALKTAQAQAASVLEPLLSLVKNKSRKQALSRIMGNADAAVKTSIQAQSFEAIMRPITNLALSEARHTGKRISLSYAADFDDVDQDTARHMQKFLEIMCLNIVGSGIGTQRTQISITGQMRSHSIGITLSWAGYNIQDAAQLNTHLKRVILDVRTLGGEVNIHTPALIDTRSGEDNSAQNQSVEVIFPRYISPANTSAAQGLQNQERRSQ